MSKGIITQALVLAAGLGTRMGPLTEDRPKPLVEVAGRTLIDRVIDRLGAAGVTRIVVNLHYKADQLQSHLEQRSDVEIVFSDERGQLLDTGGGLAQALPLFGDQPFIVHNSDSIWVEGLTQNLKTLMKSWDAARMDCLLLLSLRDQALGFDGAGDFFCGPEGHLTRRGVAPQAPFVWTGVQIINPAFLTTYPDGAFSANVFLDQAMARQRLFGIILDGIWMHVGSPAGVRAAHQRIISDQNV